MYVIVRRPSILRNNQNTIVTAGLICAPLTFPMGDSAIEAPIDPKRKPVIIWRTLIAWNDLCHWAAGSKHENYNRQTTQQ